MPLGKAGSVSGLLLFGTITSLSAKIVYELQGTGADGSTKYFHKPWAMTTVMFMGMTFCLPLAFIQQAAAKRKAAASADPSRQPLLDGAANGNHGGDGGAKHGELRQVLLLTIPTAFDLVATVLMNVGLLSVTASVYQMMRGAEMLFAALFAVVFLRRSLNRYHLWGLACCVAGISLVGLSSLMSGQGSATQVVSTDQMLLGMGLIILSQSVQAAQLTFEDFFMADLNMEPLKIVGYEGLFGTLAMVVVMLPLVSMLPGAEGEGIREDSRDTWHMIASSRPLQVLLAIDMVALLLYNVAGMLVTGHLGAVFRTVLETMRTVCVWIVDLGLFYIPLGLGQLGEAWTRYSLVQAAGFVVLVAGTLVYGKGDEEGAHQELQTAVAEALEGGGLPAAAPAVSASQPISAGARVAAVPITMRESPAAAISSSFKATYNITSASYSRSVSRSIPRRPPVFDDGGQSHE